MVGLYIAADGLIWSNDDRPLNYLIAKGAIFATAGGYGLYKDFIAAPLGHVYVNSRKEKTSKTGARMKVKLQIRN